MFTGCIKPLMTPPHLLSLVSWIPFICFIWNRKHKFRSIHYIRQYFYGIQFLFWQIQLETYTKVYQQKYNKHIAAYCDHVFIFSWTNCPDSENRGIAVPILEAPWRKKLQTALPVPQILTLAEVFGAVHHFFIIFSGICNLVGGLVAIFYFPIYWE